MSNRNYNKQTNPNRQKLASGGRAKKNMGGSMNARADMRSGYYPSDMGMEGGAMYKRGGPVKKKSKFSKFWKAKTIIQKILLIILVLFLIFVALLMVAIANFNPSIDFSDFNLDGL